MAIFGPKHWVFGQQNEICGQNATRDLFLYHQKGAACKIWANSDGSFSRSGVEWNKRLKLNFWYRTRAGGPTPPSKVRVDRWGRPPRGRVARVMDRAHTPTHTHPTVWPLRRSWSRAIWRVRSGRSKFWQVTEWLQLHYIAYQQHCCNYQKTSILSIWAQLWSKFVDYEAIEGGGDVLVWGKCFLDGLFQIARRAIWNNLNCILNTSYCTRYWWTW